MKNKDLNKLLFIVFCFSALIFILTFFFSNDSFSRQKSVDSALLNPKYKNDVSLILIQDGTDENKDGSEISIKKTGETFFVQQDGKTDFADQKIIGLLLNNFTKIRKLYKISSNNYKDVKKNAQNIKPILDNSLKNNTTYENFSSQKKIISFYDSKNSLLPQICFSSQNQLLNRITIFSSDVFYEIEDDVSQFLTQNFNYWADGSLFPEIKNPVKITYSFHKLEDSASLSQISFSDEDSAFSALKSEILALRHGNESDTQFDFSSVYSSLRIDDGSGLVSVLSFQKMPDGNFICSKKIFSSESNSQTQKSFQSINAVYEISSWTLKKIESVFEI